MNILFAAAEVHPFIKTGGLADVIGALPQALKKSGADVRVILPKYKSIPEEYKEAMEPVITTDVPLGWRRPYCGIEMLVHDGIPVYFVDNEYYFGRDGVYGYMDDGERFAFFNRAVLDVLPQIEFKPDVLHSHDWHAGMIPLLLEAHYAHDPFYSEMRTVFTIHNLLYQGVFPHDLFSDLLELDDRYFTADGAEYYGNVNFLKAGVVFADHVTTVSPTYAKEVQTSYYGYGLDGLLSSLGDRFTGIVNGIDTKSYNPAADNKIAVKYRTSLSKKIENKIELQKELGLPVRPDAPLMVMVTRLVDSKGLDLVCRVLDELLYYDDIQFAVLGTGDPAYEHWFREAANRYPLKMSAQITFNDGLSRRFYAGSDLFLMPSRFEPCGISQLLALRYGSVPLVRETGGLNDTVQAYNEFSGEGNGFSFTSFNAHDMMNTIRRAEAFYRQPEHWKKIVKNAMSGDYSWNVSAEEYMGIYRRITLESVK
ncbi:glycogen synthase GlgA [Paenibacillus sp. UMB7766-LJ446]|uniref:glycogen synthase GlgA n=1 Tax=Paenibacillus TaxID=44249 RepID=UPI0003FB3935|nr:MULTISPECIES: glycogen synthase GlgA [Paenibacillus]KGP78001.1 glycogen synthase [Paenibacillus sp. MAEPY2]KGP79128.1 glycogen synthase [Paenibacillus sp. MAEPY1]MDK8189469.1 glycogen synthase GlgA [Paenibacillus sp. UMB7766-LJ446]OZQ73961.1 starch synthase [Paenibacillus taichungensis]HBU82939.1 glycogen synthase GlgA [Paenibacillus sp.]